MSINKEEEINLDELYDGLRDQFTDIFGEFFTGERPKGNSKPMEDIRAEAIESIDAIVDFLEEAAEKLDGHLSMEKRRLKYQQDLVAQVNLHVHDLNSAYEKGQRKLALHQKKSYEITGKLEMELENQLRYEQNIDTYKRELAAVNSARKGESRQTTNVSGVRILADDKYLDPKYEIMLKKELLKEEAGLRKCRSMIISYEAQLDRMLTTGIMDGIKATSDKKKLERSLGKIVQMYDGLINYGGIKDGK